MFTSKVLALKKTRQQACGASRVLKLIFLTSDELLTCKKGDVISERTKKLLSLTSYYCFTLNRDLSPL